MAVSDNDEGRQYKQNHSYLENGYRAAAETDVEASNQKSFLSRRGRGNNPNMLIMSRNFNNNSAFTQAN